LIDNLNFLYSGRDGYSFHSVISTGFATNESDYNFIPLELSSLGVQKELGGDLYVTAGEGAECGC